MTRAIEVRLELRPFLADDTSFGQGEDLKPPAIGQDGAMPADEFMEAAASRNQFIAGAEEQVVGVAENDFGTRVNEVSMQCRLHRPLRPDRHERRRLHNPMRGVQLATSRRAVSAVQGEMK